MNLTLYRYYYQLKLKLQDNSLMFWALFISILLHLWLFLIELPYDQYLQTGKVSRPPFTVKLAPKPVKKLVAKAEALRKPIKEQKKPVEKRAVIKTVKKPVNKTVAKLKPVLKPAKVAKPVQSTKPVNQPVTRITKTYLPAPVARPAALPKPAPAPQPKAVTNIAPPPMATPEVASPVVELQPKEAPPPVAENVRGVTLTPSLADKAVVEQAPVAVPEATKAPEPAKPKPVVIEHEPIVLPPKPTDTQIVEAPVSKPEPQVIEHEPIILPVEPEIAEAPVIVPEPTVKPQPVVIEHEPIILPKDPEELPKPKPVVIEHEPILLPPETKVAEIEPLPEVQPAPEPVFEPIPEYTPEPELLPEIAPKQEAKPTPLPEFEPEPEVVPEEKPKPVVIEHEPILLPIEPSLPKVEPEPEVEVEPLTEYKPEPVLEPEEDKIETVEETPEPATSEPETPTRFMAVEEPKQQDFSVPKTMTDLPNPAPVKPNPSTQQAFKLPERSYQGRFQVPNSVYVPTRRAPSPGGARGATDMMGAIKQNRQAKAARADTAAIDALINTPSQTNVASETQSQESYNGYKKRRTPSSGMFKVSTLREYEGTFSFSGWYQGAYTASRAREYQVQIFDGREDIREKMVIEMINIIRQEYNSEFQWQSNRLGMMVTLSADPKDQDQLVQFLLQEFKPHFERYLGLRP